MITSNGVQKSFRLTTKLTLAIGGPKMSGNFVREQYVAARARNFQTFLGRLCFGKNFYFTVIKNK